MQPMTPQRRRSSTRGLPWLLSLLQEYRPATAGNILGHPWTLGIEETFYIVWPRGNRRVNFCELSEPQKTPQRDTVPAISIVRPHIT